MAVGFPPKYKTDFSTNTPDAYECMVLVQETAKKIGWNLHHLSPAGFMATFDTAYLGHNLEIKGLFTEGNFQLTGTSLGSGLWDLGRNRSALENFMETFFQVKSDYPHEKWRQEAEAFRQTFASSSEEDPLLQPVPSLKQEVAGGLSLFVPKKGYTITPVLAIVNVLVFIAMLASGVHFMEPDSDSLLLWGANFKPLTLGGEWWRIISSCFIHIGVLHLVLNMYALMYIGVMLEPLLGKSRYLTAYLLAGITGSLCSLWWHDLTISAGASGAIFGMYGVFLALLTTNLVHSEVRKSLLPSISIFVAYNLFFGLKGGVDNAAHIGGLLGGILVGYAFVPSLQKKDALGLKYGSIALVTILVTIGTFFAFKSLPNDLARYQSILDAFLLNEEESLHVFEQQEQPSEEELLLQLQGGIRNWKNNDSLLDESDHLNLPDATKHRNGDLHTYTDLRIQEFELLYKAIAENTDRYTARIEATRVEIKKVLDSINAEEPVSE